MYEKFMLPFWITSIIVMLLLFVFAGCTDTDRAYINAHGSSGVIKCYSGGKLIFEGESTGIIQTTTNSDGWEFQQKSTLKFIRVSGDCVIEN